MKKEKEDKSNKIKWILFILIIIGIFLFLWARYISTSGLVIKEYAIVDNNLPESFDGFKIVQFSDVHIGTTVNLKRLKKIVQRINDQKPDIVLFTGDLFDERVAIKDEEIEKIIKILNGINPKIETIAVIGNHDYVNNAWGKVIPFLNWKLLDNTYDIIYNNSNIPIVITGFDDLSEGMPDYNNAFSFINEINDTVYTIAIMHEPDQIDNILNYNFNLAIAGHSHLGQVRFPLIGAIWTPKGAKKYYNEHYIVNNRDLYISGGIGTSLMNIRFFVKPSITLYRFYTK